MKTLCLALVVLGFVACNSDEEKKASSDASVEAGGSPSDGASPGVEASSGDDAGAPDASADAKAD